MACKDRNEVSADHEICVEFARRRKLVTLAAVDAAVFVGAILMLGYFGLASKVLIALMFGIGCVFGGITHYKVWRCPACNGHLGKLYLGLKEPKHCPQCGVKLIE